MICIFVNGQGIYHGNYDYFNVVILSEGSAIPFVAIGEPANDNDPDDDDAVAMRMAA